MTQEFLLLSFPNWPNWVAFSVFVLSGLSLLLLLYRKLGEGERRLTARLAGLKPDRAESETVPTLSYADVAPLYREEGEGAGWRQRLQGRALPITILLLLLLGILAIGIVDYPLVTLASAGGVMVLAGGFVAFHAYRRNARRRRFIDQLPEAIDIIIRGARVGMSLQENFQVIAREMPDPVGSQFRILAEKLGIGIDLETALGAAVEEVAVKELQFMATTLILQRRTGGQYTDVLENLAQVLRDRRAQFLKAKALTSESRVSARIVTIVTGVILVILAATNKAQFDFLFEDPLGHNLLIYSGISILVGFFILSRLLRTLQ